MSLAIAFVAGLVSCVSPCVLPVVPVFAGFVAGGTRPGWSPAGAAIASPARGSATWRAVGFLMGFLGVFVLLWASIGVVGFALMGTVPFLRQATGALIIAMGALMMAGRHPMMMLPARFARVGRGGPLLLGAGVAVGWTPCIGPTLGAILALAASSSTVGGGLLLLVAYAAGLAVPFLLVLVGLRRFRSASTWLAAHGRLVDVISGALVAGVGVLVFSGLFARLAGLFNLGIL